MDWNGIWIDTSNRWGIRSAAALALGLLLSSAATARAQDMCTGDCDGDGEVAINELILGVNIALGSQAVDNCPSFDIDGDGTVAINELIKAVNNALTGCVSGPVCGDGFVDLAGGETCDDGNTVDGDDCPANCHVAACQPSGTKVSADVDFTTDPADLPITGLELFIRYPDGVVGIPGSAGDAAVMSAVTSSSFSLTPNDRDYGLTAVLFDSTFAGVPAGTALHIEFDLCQGASAPSPGDFACVVNSAADIDLNTVTNQVTCAVVFP